MADTTLPAGLLDSVKKGLGRYDTSIDDAITFHIKQAIAYFGMTGATPSVLASDLANQAIVIYVRKFMTQDDTIKYDDALLHYMSLLHSASLIPEDTTDPDTDPEPPEPDPGDGDDEEGDDG